MHNTAAYQIRKPSLPRRLRHTAVAAAIAAVAMVALPGLASAQQLSSVSIDTFRSSGTLVLDVNGASTTPGATVIQWFRNGGSNQRSNVVDPGYGNELIVNQNSGMCLTSDGVAGHWVYQWPCENSNEHQQWVGDLDSITSHVTSLMNVASGQYLDVNGDSPWPGAHLITWYWDQSAGEGFGD